MIAIQKIIAYKLTDSSHNDIILNDMLIYFNKSMKTPKSNIKTK